MVLESLLTILKGNEKSKASTSPYVPKPIEMVKRLNVGGKKMLQKQ